MGVGGVVSRGTAQLYRWYNQQPRKATCHGMIRKMRVQIIISEMNVFVREADCISCGLIVVD